ncbi:Clp protease N-terminal domain-containing protein [Streptomyces sp. NPDC007162]|uniref:Clp protease N-terminal domain-containing protein n=1 Tax=Streptomyces sp. NPDC007162 TaxID=3156917 RepID=UPI00340E83A2
MGYERFGERAQDVVGTAADRARRLRHWYVEPGHVLLALLDTDEPEAVRLLGGAAEDLRAGVIDALGRGTVEPGGHLPLSGGTSDLFERASQEADRLGHRAVEPFHLLLALLSAADTVVMEVLAAHRTDPRHVPRPTADAPGTGHAPRPAPGAPGPAHDPYVWAMS